MNCPFCGYKNNDQSANNCEFCGRNLSEEAKPIIKTVKETKTVYTNVEVKKEYVPLNSKKSSEIDTTRNALGYIDLKTRFFHHILYACAGYVLMYVLFYAYAFISIGIYKAQGVDFSGITDGTASSEVVLIYTRINTIGQVVAEIGVVLLTLLVFKKYIKLFFKQFTQGNTYKWYAIGFGLLYGLNILYSVLLTILKIESDTNANQQSVIDLVTKNPFLGLLFVVVAAPIFEELIFRFGVFRTFTCSNGKNKKKIEIIGLILTTIIFAGVHMIATFEEMAADPANAMALLKNDMVALPSYLIGAFGLTFTYYKSKNLASSMLAHMTWNFLSFIAIFAQAGAIIFHL